MDESLSGLVSLVPRPSWGRRGPGIHCLRMRQSVPTFLVHRILLRISVRIPLRHPRIVSLSQSCVSAMAADSSFSASVSYALTCLKTGDLQLKDKQVEALKTLYGHWNSTQLADPTM